ncbi:MAG: bifunctional phosphoribosylaminoimidazolecarboxamide formyltransferase/IMP cyclohydrolase [Candidatus Omnitrophota bacterium]|jgi:phosphoribosylaminoimidazolecarboxamide formyltransferase/IMP cyclohydrolase
MISIKRALISVSDKTGIVDFSHQLNKLGVEILSTGGTARLLKENKIPVIDVSDYTGFPEMLDGRVKTLHPKIHAGLLALRDNPAHMQTLKKHNIGLIDMVVVNLYPFEKTVAKQGVAEEEAIENIDIGGPSMLRSAAKNHQSVVVISSHDQYTPILEELKRNKAAISNQTAKQLSVEVFNLTAHYDAAIYNYLSSNQKKAPRQAKEFPAGLNLGFSKLQELRYGENSHQRAALYKQKQASQGLINLKQLHGKELSFNNILDLNSTWELVAEFQQPAAVVTKHTNPCGAAEDKSLEQAFLNAWRCDSLSAFGSIVGLNRKADLKTAKLMLNSGFIECIIAPGFKPEALSLLKQKKNLRLLELTDLEPANEFDLKRVNGGLLIQDKDINLDELNNLKIVTKKKPTQSQMDSLIFAWKVVKHVKSNAIVLARGRRTVGIGAGQMSRVDSVIIAKRKAGKLAKNSCLASDAFFPKPDAIVQAARAGVVAIIQPGGSISDEEIIQACDKHKIAMVTTGRRHFKH